jgi:hypothetical protein
MTALPYGINLTEGYDPLQMRDYNKLLPPLYTQTPATWRILIENNSLLSMLNTKYLVVDNLAGNAGDVKWWIAKEGEGGRLPIPPVAMKPGATGLFPFIAIASFSVIEHDLAASSKLSRH